MAKRNVLSVKGLKIGHLFLFNNCIYKVEAFPDRRNVIGYLVYSLSTKRTKKRIRVPLRNTGTAEHINRYLEGE
jgi:hypothetical protein